MSNTAQWEYVRPKMYPKQAAAAFSPARISVCEASTKAGKTVAMICWITELALRSSVPGRNFWWIAPIYRTAHIPFSRLIRRLPAGLFQANKTDLTIHILPTDAYIWFKGADNPDSLYGEDVWGAVIDEASRCKEEAWHAIRSTLTATRGPVRIIGNLRGRKNWAYQLARRAEKGDDPELSYHKITAYDAIEAGVLNADEIRSARSTLPESVFKELYEVIPSDDSGNPFGIDAIEKCTWDGSELSGEPVVCWGWDLARKMDHSVGVGLDRWGHLAAFERFQKPWPEQIEIIRKRTENLPAMVDATGVGDPVVQLIQRPVERGTVVPGQGVPGYRRSVLDEDGLGTGFGTPVGWDDMTEGMRQEAIRNQEALHRTFGDTQIEGFLFTPKSKQGLMESLAVAIQQQTFRFPKFAEQGREHPLKLELEAFEYEYTRIGVRYTAPEGEHDDCVCAAALAVKCLHDRVASTTADMDLAGLVEGFQANSLWDLGVGSEGAGKWNIGR